MKYKDIADQIIADIQSEKLTYGQRLPSLRQLSKQWGISMTTALNSYRQLEQAGWVVTHPQSGFFVSSPLSHNNTPKQPQFRSSLRAVPSRRKYSDFSDSDLSSGPFGISQLCPSPAPLLALKRSIKRTAQRGDEYLYSYPNPQGVMELRSAIEANFSHYGFPVSADDLCISSGCMDAIRVALSVTTEVGDAVGITSPCFNGLLKLLSAMSRKVVEIPCNADGVDLDQLEQKLANKEISACLFSSSFMNPHGISLSILQKQRLAALANKYRVPMIEDDVYGELGHNNTFPLPIKYWDKSGYVLWCSSISKTLANGLRIGWCHPGRYLPAYVDISTSECLGKNGLMQASLADFINSGEYRKHLQRARKTLLTNTRAYRQLLLEKLPSGSAVSSPEGGMVLWVQVPNLDSEKLTTVCETLQLDIRVGPQFTTRKLYRDCFRLNLGWSLADMHDDERTIKQALLQLCKKMPISATV